jgi:uncharacterized protein YecE (DUF72 family)
VQRWAASTPPGFKFCVKVPRAITHELGLVGAGGLMGEFIETMGQLEDKLGVILLQFPPSFTFDQFPILDHFLQEVPSQERFAVEIRDRSWYTAADETAEMLRNHGVCWAATEYPGLPDQIRLTTDYLYIRWIGKHGSYTHHDHERTDMSAELRRWWVNLQDIQDDIEAVFGFFNNDYAGYAPGTANRFKQIVGLPVEDPDLPTQGRLF